MTHVESVGRLAIPRRYQYRLITLVGPAVNLRNSSVKIRPLIAVKAIRPRTGPGSGSIIKRNDR